jgi:predicted amidohydrolase
MSLIVAAAQSHSIPGEIEQNLAHHLRLARLAAAEGADFLIFPELSISGYEPTLARAKAMAPDSALLDPLRQLAEETQMTIVAGAPVLGESGALHIAAFVLQPGAETRVQTKQYLHSSEEAVFSPGKAGKILQVNKSRVGLAICADTSHPEHAAAAAAQGAELYAAGALFSEKGYDADAKQLQHYAREHRMAVLLANYSGTSGGWQSAGKSALWNEAGELIAAAPDDAEVLIVGEKKAGGWQGRVLQVSAKQEKAAL